MTPAARQTDFGSDPIVVAYGAGVESTAMLIGLRDRRVPVALILFADTGSEKPETYAYLPIIQDWLTRQGMPPVTVLRRNSPRAGDTSLHGECIRKRVLPSHCRRRSASTANIVLAPWPI
jgi:3'-phosphoadenosine 5'-phosphosulfate sulfotransferase (PAPS reductase)/FAD synthetase